MVAPAGYPAAHRPGQLPSPIVTRSRIGRAWDVASDLLIATALLWTLPLLLAAAAVAVRLLREAL